MKDDMKKSMNLNDLKVICYLGIFILLLFIILPPLFRVLFPKEEEDVKEEENKLVTNLSCEKTQDFVEYKLKTIIKTNYIDGNIDNSKFTYEIEFVEDFLEEDEIEIDEYDDLKKVSNVDFEEKDNVYILTINYSKFDYSNEPLLENHMKTITEQMKIYSDEDFECEISKLE